MVLGLGDAVRVAAALHPRGPGPEVPDHRPTGNVLLPIRAVGRRSEGGPGRAGHVTESAAGDLRRFLAGECGRAPGDTDRGHAGVAATDRDCAWKTDR